MTNRTNIIGGALLVASLLILGACEDPELARQREQRYNRMAVGTDTIPRFQITRVGVFRDDLAYRDVRGIYVLKDTTTGKEFVGVSGIGISEIGVHSAGKNQTRDER